MLLCDKNNDKANFRKASVSISIRCTIRGIFYYQWMGYKKGKDGLLAIESSAKLEM